MAEVVIDREKLTSYKESVSALQFAISKISGDQKKTLSALKSFLSDYLSSIKYPKESIDAQNFYFSKKQAEQIVAIFEKYSSLPNTTIASYVSSAIDGLGLDGFLFYTKDVSTFKKKVSDALEEVLDKVSNKKDATKGNNEDSSEEKPSLAIKDIPSYVKNNLYIPKLNLSAISDFLNKNVFANISKAILTNSFSFEATDKITRTLSKRTSLFFKKIWNPTISELKNPFRRFEYRVTRGATYKMKASVKRYAKRFFRFIDTLFPVIIIASVIKIGFKIVKASFGIVLKSIKLASKLATTAFSFVKNTFNSIVKTSWRIGKATASVLANTLKKIASLSIVKITTKMLLGFFKTPTGAYILGFVVGRIYRKIKDVFGSIPEIYENLKAKFETAKNWLEANVVVPYIDPILAWIDTVKLRTDFTIAQVRNVFEGTEGQSLVARIEATLALFEVTDEKGAAAVSFNDILKKISYIENVVEDISNFDAKKFLIVEGGRMLGGIVGAKLGAAVGQAVIPIPIVGAVIGALLGGFAGDAMGKIIGELITKTSPFNPPKKEESKVAEYIRKNIGYSGNTTKAALYGRPSSIQHVELLRSLGSLAETKIDLENAPQIAQLERYGIDIRGKIAEDRAAGKDDFRNSLKLFKNIDNLSYDKIHREIAESITELYTLLEAAKGVERNGHKKTTPRGFLTINDLRSMGTNWNTTILSLSGNKELLGTSENVWNPYWFKAIRAIAILNQLRRLNANQISPFAFVEFMESISGRGTKVDERGVKNGIDIDAIMKDETFSKISITMPYTHKNANYSQTISAADLVFGTYFTKGTGMNAKFETDKPTVNPIQVNSLVAYWPLDEDIHLFSKRLMQMRDFSDLIIGNATREETYKIDGLTPIYDSTYRSLLGTENLGRVNEEEVALRISQQIGRDSFAAMKDDEKSSIVKSIIEQIAEGRTTTYVDSLLAPLERALRGMQESFTSNSVSLSESLANTLNFESADGYSITLDNYRKLVSENNDFAKNKIIPALRTLIDSSGIKNKSELYAILGIPYPSEETVNAASTAAGKMADPNVN